MTNKIIHYFSAKNVEISDLASPIQTKIVNKSRPLRNAYNIFLLNSTQEPKKKYAITQYE